MTTFTCSYRFDGRTHVVHVDAADEAQASRKLRAIGMTAQIDGELIAEIPAGPIGKPLTGLARLFGARR